LDNRSHHILLVEDDPDVGPVLEHVLIAAGYGVHWARTSAEAHELLDARQYDLLVTDVMLPDGNGIAIADAAQDRGIKSVVITGHAFQLPRADLERHQVLLKPLRPRELVGAVERRLGSSA
jgi:DNA-binding response OmpR family regulator